MKHLCVLLLLIFPCVTQDKHVIIHTGSVTFLPVESEHNYLLFQIQSNYISKAHFSLISFIVCLEGNPARFKNRRSQQHMRRKEAWLLILWDFFPSTGCWHSSSTGGHCFEFALLLPDLTSQSGWREYRSHAREWLKLFIARRRSHMFIAKMVAAICHLVCDTDCITAGNF